MRNLVYNATIIRFRPYRELGEFVNIGIALCFPQLCRCLVKVDHRITRITTFFPEIDKVFLRNSLKTVRDELKELLDARDKDTERQELVLDFKADQCIQNFRNLVMHREGIFIFGDTISGLAEHPQEKMNELFEIYVKRQFQNSPLYQDYVLESEFRKTLRAWKYSTDFKKGRIGNADYNVAVPFFNEGISIKTLSLDKPAVEIYEAGDKWISRVNRLISIGGFNSSLLFSVKYPDDPKRHNIANDIVTELGKTTGMVSVCRSDDNDKILWNIRRAVQSRISK